MANVPLNIVPLPSDCSVLSSCPSTPKGILRAKCPLQRIPTDSSCGSCRVRFAEAIDQHTADDYDRSKCPTATPTFREIRELERIRRELCPDGRGISDQSDEEEQQPSDRQQPFFEYDGECDVDRPRPRPRRLRGVPIELCPLLPACAPLMASAPTPCNSSSPSPLNSPLGGSPMLSPVSDGPNPNHPKRRQPRAMMTFLPILPPTDSPAPVPTSIPTPPETPTLLKLDLSDSHHGGSHHDAPQPHRAAPLSPPPAEPREFITSSPPRTYSVLLSTSSSPSRPPPTTCRMTILPLHPQKQSPLPDRVSSSVPLSNRPCMASMSFVPVNVPTTYSMSYKATART